MKHEKRIHERTLFRGMVTLTSPDQEDITATLVNISLGGLLISEPSSPIDKKTEYKTQICSIAQKPIILSVLYARQKEQHVGMRITQYHLDGKNQLKTLMTDLKYTEELVELLEEGWLDYFFEDDQERELEFK